VRVFVGLVLAGLILSGSQLVAADNKPLPKEMPPYGALAAVKTPVVKVFMLDNGMTVWLVPQPGFPKVSITVAVKGGYTADPKERPGLADLLAATLTQGSTGKSAKQLAEEIAAAGGDLDAGAAADSITIAASVLSAKVEATIQLLADVMQRASFAENEVEIAKTNLLSSLEANEADPSFLARRALYQALFGEHPYAVTAPTREALAATSASELKREFARRMRPDRTMLVAVGDFGEAALSESIRSTFGAWKAVGEAAPIVSEKPQPRFSKAVVYVSREGSVQTALYLGTLGPERAAPDYAAARVATAIYGGMFGSRLVNNIREDKGYTYSPGARLTPNTLTGVLVTRADVRNAVTGASFNEMQYELNRMATTVPDEEEVEHAKQYLLGSLALQLQSQAAVSRALSALWVDGLPPEELSRQASLVQSVKPADVQAAGRRYFPAWRSTIVAVGEEKVIRDELGAFGLEFQKVH
jgi:zinc protease